MVLASRCCARIARTSALAAVGPRSYIPASRRWNTSAAEASVDPKIKSIVDDISGLTLLQTAALVSSLKSRLNIPDVALQSFAAAPAAAPAAKVEEVEEEVVQEKTMFNVKLQSIDPSAKPKIIKEVKSLLGLSLVDSKKFVESAPKVLKEGLSKEDAEKVQKTFQDLGAKVDLE